MTDPIQTPGSGYGKRPLWQWIILYVIVGGAVYGLIYYFLLAQKGGYTPSSSQTPSTNESPTQPAPRPTGSSY